MSQKILLRTKRDPSDQLEIDGLLMENLELREALDATTDECGRYRELYLRCIHIMHGLVHQADRQSDTIDTLREANRELRAELAELRDAVRHQPPPLGGPSPDGPQWVQ